MIVYRDNKPYVEFDIDKSYEGAGRISLPLEVYLKLAEEAVTLEALRREIFRVHHEILDMRQRDWMKTLNAKQQAGRRRARTKVASA